MPSMPEPQACRKWGGVPGDCLAHLDAVPDRLLAPQEQLAKVLSSLIQRLRPARSAHRALGTSYAFEPQTYGAMGV
jgi:hypothetical protein